MVNQNTIPSVSCFSQMPVTATEGLANACSVPLFITALTWHKVQAFKQHIYYLAPGGEEFKTVMLDYNLGYGRVLNRTPSLEVL